MICRINFSNLSDKIFGLIGWEMNSSILSENSSLNGRIYL